MSAPTIRTPWEGQIAPSPDEEERTYDQIPSLRDLMKRTGGLPGIIYAQVAMKNVTDAQAGRWPDPDSRLDDLLFSLIHPVRRGRGKPRFSAIGGISAYRITGPKGSADVVLMGSGARVPGLDPKNGRRRQIVDPDICTLTGLPDPNPYPKPETKETSGAQERKS